MTSATLRLARRVLTGGAVLTPFILTVACSSSGQTTSSTNLAKSATGLYEAGDYDFAEQASFAGGATALLHPWTASGISLAPDHFEDTQTIGTTKLTLVEIGGKFWIRFEDSKVSRVQAGSLPANLGSPESVLRWLAGATVDRQHGEELYFHALASKSVDLVDFAGKASVNGEATIERGSLREVSLKEQLPDRTTFSFTVAFNHIGKAASFSSP